MRAGDVLGGRYRLDERIAAGGMGTVWRGHDDRLHRVVAVKMLHAGLSGKDSFRRRFHIEARAIASLDAPGIVNVYDYGEENTEGDGEVVYLVMQLVEGDALATVLRRGTLTPAETLTMLADCADALSVAHREGVIHRDIKPGNILVDSHRNVKIVDFGIARTPGHDGVTTTGMVMGSMPYIAPEQLRGVEPNPSGDIYSLGVVGYQCLAGRPPFDHQVPAATITATLSEQPPPLPAGVPGPVAAIIMRALEKDPKRRWDDAGAFAAACRTSEAVTGAEVPRAVTRPATAHTDADTLGVTLGTRRSRRRALLWTATMLSVVLLLGLTVAIVRPWQGGDIANGAGDTTTPGSSTAGSSPDSSDTSAETATEADTAKPNDPTATSRSDDESSSSGPENITVPDVTGTHMGTARQRLEDKGFTNIGVSSPNGCRVTSQYPNAGSRIKPNDYIELGIEPETHDRPCPIF